MAVGLASESGMRYLKGISARLHLLVGIDLPTPPSVLRKLLARAKLAELEFKVYAIDGVFFHPKLYVWQKAGRYKAYVGSGNLSRGGWHSNVELFWPVEDSAMAEKLKNWFVIYWDKGILPDEKYIADYEARIFRPYDAFERERRKKMEAFKKGTEPDYEYFFRREDFEAFAPGKTDKSNLQAKGERKLVYDKLKALHLRLKPFIESNDWQLYPHHRLANMVSHYAHNRFTNKVLNAMWLYYGKSPTEIAACHQVYHSGNTPNDHVRLQVIIRHETVGVWCAIGKDNGSLADRRSFHQKIQDDDQLAYLFELLKNLGGDYFIDVAEIEPVYVRDLNTPADLYALVNQDSQHLDAYFIIGLNVLPHDERLLDDRIVPFVIGEFEKLYPLYLFVKAPFPEVVQAN
jgi:hypothetical protein